MRTYGRITQADGSLKWVVVETDVNGDDSYVYITTLIQNLKLILGESPFFANNGIPAIQSVLTQIFPDYYVNQIQTQFAQYFSSLIISRQPPSSTDLTPIYNVNLVTKQGKKIYAQVAS